MIKRIIKLFLGELAQRLEKCKRDVVLQRVMQAFGSCGENVEICYPFDIRLPENIIVGNRVFIGPKVTIGAWKGGEVIIEDDVMIGPDVAIFGADHDYAKKNVEIKDSGYGKIEPVIIKKGAWIGTKAIILRGVIVGKGAIVGAGSVVTQNIPDNEIWGGNPARFLRRRFNDS